jgi:inorganic pyrophosphatase
MIEDSSGVDLFISLTALIGFLFGVFQIFQLKNVPVGEVNKSKSKSSGPVQDPYLLSLIGTKFTIQERNVNGKIEEVPVEEGKYFNSWEEVVDQLVFISKSVDEGATAFLYAEYKILAVFIVIFSLIIALLVEELGQFWTVGAFILGALTSVASGFIGMKVAVYSNSRTAYSAIDRDNGLANAFIVAFRGGSVLGFCLSSLGLLNLWLLITCYRSWYLGDDYGNHEVLEMMEAIAGYGLGGSTIAMFGRVGGGIYTKAADVGADLAGKVEEGLEEDDPRNPATIADNVGDNVGDIAGMGSDLFGSFAESTCAALVVAATSPELLSTSAAMMYPLLLSAAGILVCIITSFFATNVMKVNEEAKIERTLKWQLLISTILLTPALFLVSQWALPDEFSFHLDKNGEDTEVITGVQYYHAYACVASGLWSGLIIGVVTEYFTSHSYTPVLEVAESCKTGSATNIIYGLALGYLSCVIPTFCLAFTIYLSFYLSGMYGIALAALGMLSNLAISLAIDGYGPISDNAGGMVEMIHLEHSIRDRTDALDAAGNTTAAIGKGFAIGSAALVSLALFGAFITRAQ